MEFEDNRRRYSPKNYWTQLFGSNLISLLSLLVFLCIGIIFYKSYDEMTWSEAYYYAVSQGLRIGYSTPSSDIDDGSKTFTLLFKFVGICILAFYYTNLLRASYFQRSQVRKNRLYVVLAVALVVMFAGIMWSYYTVNWSVVNSFYFVFSTYFWWGIYSLPDDPTDSEMSTTATLAVIGGVAVYTLLALWSCDVEKWIEKYLLRGASQKPFTGVELGMVKKLGTLQSNASLRLQSNVRLMGVDPDTEEQQQALQQVVEGTTEDVLGDELVKKLLLLRILSQPDVSLVYYYVRWTLTGGFLLLFLIGILFYHYYDKSSYVSLALSYTVSAMYRLGYSNDDIDGFSQMMSSLLMLCGCVLFNVLTVTLTREYSLKSADIRYLHIAFDAVLCLLLVVLATLMFMYAYDWTYWSSSLFAIDIMIGYGGSVPSSEQAWTYWMLDIYSIISMPLFTALLSHLEVELDVGDSLGYLTDALNHSFSKNDMQLVEVFEDFHNHVYSNLERSKTDSRTVNNVYGTYELHVLLVLRMKDMRESELNVLLNSVRQEYRAALAAGVRPEVYDSAAEEMSDDQQQQGSKKRNQNNSNRGSKTRNSGVDGDDGDDGDDGAATGGNNDNSHLNEEEDEEGNCDPTRPLMMAVGSQKKHFMSLL